MLSKVAPYCLIMILLALSAVVYANDNNGCAIGVISRTYNRALTTLCKMRSCKSHHAQKPVQRGQDNINAVPAAPANTFENYIAPFIKTVAPHFYEKILKKDDVKLPVSLRTKEA